jgi:hypothetical protein
MHHPAFENRLRTDLDTSAAFIPSLYEGVPDIPPEMTLDEYRRARFAGRPPARRRLARLGMVRRARA